MIYIPAKGQLSGYFINCENCGKEIYQTKTQYNRAKHHFCSNKCQKDFQHNQLFEDRVCEKALMYAFQNQKRLIDDYMIKFVVEHEMLGMVTS